MSTRDTITITQKEADLAASIFGSNKANKTRVGTPLRYYELAKDVAGEYRLEIIFPKQGEDGTETLSFMTAFIIKVVYEAFNEVDPLDKENSLALMSLNAQTIALQLLKKTRQWTGDNKDPSLLDYDKRAIQQIIKQTYDRGPVKITRNATDRVTSILTWEATKHVDAALMMELSLPHM
ncbi:hypothetical protein ANCCAN_07624 [Ancylostoma caninum]|uniref:Uncharacterized protein n=1 Tax=Ancylostoma caninum TaxID=29170 RepID=A0A368GTF3_ANCCA|nr:hypothetical protein ANCCAN_07624 [Ancylostoma caninum]